MKMGRKEGKEIASRKLLPAGAVAEILGLSRQHVYTMAASGELPSIKLRGAVRFDQADVDRFIREHRREGATPKDAA
jgi:excisionase family DNA binding protein